MDDGSWRVRVLNAAPGEIEFLNPKFCMDMKAMLLCLGREGNSGLFSCPWNIQSCNTRMMKWTVASIPMTTTIGDLRDIQVRNETEPEPEYEDWKADEDSDRSDHLLANPDLSNYVSSHLPTLEVLDETYRPPGQQKPIYVGKGKTPLFDGAHGFGDGFCMVQADFEEWTRQRRRGQVTMPDSTVLSQHFPIECLHCSLRCMDHHVETAASIVSVKHENLFDPPTKTRMDLNKHLSKEFQIPLLGLAGKRSKDFQSDPTWLKQIMAPGLGDAHDLTAESHQQFERVSPLAYHMVESLFNLNQLLRVLWDAEPYNIGTLNLRGQFSTELCEVPLQLHLLLRRSVL